MFEETVQLQEVHITNFLSLRDVDIPLKRLTVLVGPNACGKSNIIKALRLLRKMMIDEELPSVKTIQESLWAGEANHIAFGLQTALQESRIEYDLIIEANADNLAAGETLSVNDIQLISTRNGKRWVQDEDRQKAIEYKSNKLAVSTVGDVRNEPITKAFAQSIQDWHIYDFRPDLIRRGLKRLSSVGKSELREPKTAEYPLTRGDRRPLSHDLWDWYNHDRERFESVNQSLQASMNLKVDQREINGDSQFCLLGKHTQPIPLTRASDGTLRFLEYYILLNLPNPPSLIALEEPERNLHPGAIIAVADFLEQLAKGSQVIITTHSSQLLDTFDSESLSDLLEVLLLRNPQGRGTEVTNLEEIRGNRPALDGWITDFGIGSAIFDSALLREPMKTSA